MSPHPPPAEMAMAAIEAKSHSILFMFASLPVDPGTKRSRKPRGGFAFFVPRGPLTASSQETNNIKQIEFMEASGMAVPGTIRVT